MITANVHEAKTHLSSLLDKADSGKSVYITRRQGGGRGDMRYKIVAQPAAKNRSAAFGVLKNQIQFAKDYDTADAEILAMFDADITG